MLPWRRLNSNLRGYLCDSQLLCHLSLSLFFLSKRQVWSRSMSVVWPFITAAMKARLMDMKAQSIGQEREIREGWVTIFLLLDNHVMPFSLSRDIADWCLSFISPALIWQSTFFIIISAENLYCINLSFPAPHLWSGIFLKKKKESKNTYKADSSERHVFIYWSRSKINKKNERGGRIDWRWRRSVRKGCSVKQTVIVKWHSGKKWQPLSWCRPNKQTEERDKVQSLTFVQRSHLICFHFT